jgi:hypothetical protein
MDRTLVAEVGKKHLVVVLPGAERRFEKRRRARRGGRSHDEGAKPIRVARKGAERSAQS